MSFWDKYFLCKEIEENYWIKYNPEYFDPIAPRRENWEETHFIFCYMRRKFNGLYRSFFVDLNNISIYEKFLISGDLEDAVVNDIKFIE